MLTLFLALIPVLAWGTWLAPTQNVHFQRQQVRTFYVASANMLVALLLYAFMRPQPLSGADFWLPFAGGLVWAVSALCALTATSKIGIPRAFGTWAPLNILVSVALGAIIFHEFIDLDAFNLLLLALSLLVILVGVLIIILAPASAQRSDTPATSTGRDFTTGMLAAVAAGVLWGSYFIPVKGSGVSPWAASFPLAVGIFVGSTLLLLASPRQPWTSLRLPRRQDYGLAALTGLLWSIGNYGMLLLVDHIGAGKGFTIAQLSVVVSALVSIYWLKDPPPRTRTAALTLLGCFLAMAGGILLGNIK